jgi:hypothetical protein
VPIINVSGLSDLFGFEGQLRRAQITAQYWAGDGPYEAIDGDDIIVPARIVRTVRSGVLDAPIVAAATRDVCCVKWTAFDFGTGQTIEWFTSVPDVAGPVDIGALPVVDPFSFSPVEAVPTLVQTIDARIAEYNAENPADPEAIADAVSDYLTENPVEGVTEEVLTAIAAHADSETPHPVYDDMPSLTIIFDNALV